MKKLVRIWLGLTLVFGGLLVGCGAEAKEGHIGAPTKTVGQLQQWPQGFEPGGGDFRPVDMPAEAKRNVVEASPESAGNQDYFYTLQRP
ncbi:MAG: hypothetical protein ACE5G5_01055 [Candidatus Methylomirabilales bacterium]